MKDEKKIKEMMISENADYDDVEMESEELEAESDMMIKGSNEISPEEKTIMEKIRRVLDEHELKYLYDEDEPKHIGIGFGMDNKPFNVHVILQNGKVIIKLSFPFRVQANAIAIMGIYMAEFNSSGTAFSLLSTDFDNGELYIDYSYLLDKPEEFDEENFWAYMISHIKYALETYTKVAHLSIGMVPRKNRQLYKKILEMALETINGDFDDDNVSYGTESLRSDSHPDLSHLFGEENAGVDKDDSESEDDSIPDFIRNMRRRRRMPSIEEFMRMKEQAEEDNEEQSKDQDKKSANVLSMFAKRDKDKEPKAVGGNEDE